MKKLLPFLLLFSFSRFAFPATITAIANGNWSASTTWSLDRVPTCGDSIVIPAEFTVNIDVQVDLSSGACAVPNCFSVQLTILGTLHFNNGKKMALCDNSTINFGPSGQITPGGGGNSNLLTIGTTEVWRAANGTINSITNPTTMPVELISFYTSLESKKVVLHWETAVEANNRNFEIERSSDGVNFQKIGTVNSKAANGNSTIKLSYQFTDQEPGNTGTHYYRLKQNDFNGVFKYSPVATIDIEPSKNIVFTVYPNPNQGQFTVDFSGVENNHEIEVIMFDQEGKIVYSNTFTSKSVVTNTYDVIPSMAISKGMYMVNFIVEGVKYPVKVIVQ